MDKCFCHFNGYEVKDSKARTRLDTLENETVPTLETTITNNASKQNRDNALLTMKYNQLAGKIGSMSYSVDVVASIDEMTDTNKVYINSTNGHWYYYSNGWIDGGQFLPNISNVEINYNNLLNDVKLMLTGVKELDLYMENETDNIRLCTKRYLFNGKLVNNTTIPLVIRFKKFNYKLTSSDEDFTDITLNVGSSLRLDDNYLYQVYVFKTDNSVFTTDELASINPNLDFISNSVVPNIEDSSIKFDMLEEALKNLILNDNNLNIVRVDSTTCKLNNPIYGKTLINNSGISLKIIPEFVDIEGTLDSTTLNDGATLELNKEYLYNITIKKSDESEITDSELTLIQNKFTVKEDNNFELTDGCISYNHLDQDLKNRIEKKDYNYTFVKRSENYVDVKNPSGTVIQSGSTTTTSEIYIEPCKMINKFPNLFAISIYRKNLDGTSVSEDNNLPFISEDSTYGKTYTLPAGYIYQVTFIRSMILTPSITSFSDEDVSSMQELITFVDLNETTVPTKTSDLTNDSNFVSDSNYVHTDNNYTTEEKNKLANLSETSVESECSIPTITITTNLTTLLNGTTKNSELSSLYQQVGIFKIKGGSQEALLFNAYHYDGKFRQTILFENSVVSLMIYQRKISSTTDNTAFECMGSAFPTSSINKSGNSIYYPINSKAFNTYIGDKDNLTTTEKTNIVGAINELVSNISNLESRISALESSSTTSE